MSKTKRRGAKDFAAKRERLHRNKVASKRSMCKGRVVLDIETRSVSDLAAPFGGVELCPITGLPEYIFSGHKEP